MRRIRGRDVFRDDRGSLKNISIGRAWKEVNHFFSASGAVRGNHYHKDTLELIYVLDGRVEFDIADLKGGARQRLVIGANEGVLLEPYELHTLRVLEDTHWIALLSREYDPANPDVFVTGN